MENEADNKIVDSEQVDIKVETGACSSTSDTVASYIGETDSTPIAGTSKRAHSNNDTPNKKNKNKPSSGLNR